MTYNYSTVIQSINLYNSLKKNNIIGKERETILLETFTFSISTFYKWLFLHNNLSKIDYKNHFTNHKRKSKITKDVIDYILKIVVENTFIRARGIKNKIKNNFNIDISESSIRTILHKNNISFKKVYTQINPFSDEELKEKKQNLKNKIKRHGIKNVVSVDEMSIHLGEQPDKAWSKKGEKFILPTKNKSMKGKRYSLCMSVDTSSNIYYILKEKSIKSEDYNDFIKSINKKYKTKKIFLMDNATTHHSKIFKKTIKKDKINVIYNIPYHSKYNPIEYVFSLLRKEIQNCCCNTTNEIIKVVDDFIKNINERTLVNIYNNVYKMLN